MKYFGSLLIVLFSLMFAISSCQKELNFDLTATSIGTLKFDSSNYECLPSTLYGTYKQDSLLGNGNYIEVQVEVSSAGMYEIVSDTVNGYSFRGTGTFPTNGLHTARLYGTGTPLLAGINTFIISYNNTQCTIDVDVLADNSVNEAVFALGGAGSTCTGVSLTGTYMESLLMTANNTASVNISVSSPGTFTASTPTVNGVSFSASGLLSNGTTGITLTASGTPTAAGTFTYPVTAGGTTCNFTITFDPLAAPAVFTLGGAPSNCTGAILNGTYAAGITTNSSNTITINVTVSSTGSYAISSPVINGMSFSATGLFSATGAQQVVLYANGTPISSGSYTYDISSGSNSCSVSLPVTGAPTDYITCKIDGVFTEFNVNPTAGLSNASGPSILSIDGSSLAGSPDPSISLQVIKSMGGSVTPATYNVNQLSTGIAITCDYFDAASVNYFAGSDATNQNQNPAFTITVSSLTATRCVGTFSGPVKENNGAGPGQKNITEGIFNVPVQ